MANDPQDKLGKAYEKRSATSAGRKPWQETFDRHTTVAAGKSLEAAEVISGLAGSWASFLEADLNVDVNDTLSGPTSPERKASKLGQPGVPEINFTPYDQGTNRFATKGPSLLGHPISLSVVGPTLKSWTCNWQWLVTDPGPGTSDTLEIDPVDSAWSSIAGGSVPPFAATLANAYNLTDLDLYPGGLYLVISQTGAPGELDGGPPDVGLSDGFVFGANKAPLVPKTRTAKYEIFRVTRIAGGTLSLDPGKKLVDYFNFPAGPEDPYVRAVMLFEPHVTRMVAVPDSGAGQGREQTFVVVPPEETANFDLLPTFDGAASWSSGGFDPRDPPNSGTSTWYGGKVHTPIPKPIENRRGAVQKVSGAPIVVNAGAWAIDAVAPSVVTSADFGKIIRIHRVERTGGADFLQPAIATSLSNDVLLGWYEIVGFTPSKYILRRLIEVDPLNGEPYYGSSSTLILQDTLGPVGDIFLDFTVHEPVSDLHTAGYYRADKVDSARLTNLIDPSWVERSAKENTAPEGGTAARADRALWDTRSGPGASFNANPGSMLDLGFRMVVYPAKEGTGPLAGTMVPNYDAPIDSRQLVLDPSVTDEVQSIEVDYSAGLVRLSHPPVPGTDCEVAPDGIIGVDNPRGEIVLFAACVPYSMEQGQVGAGVRVTSAVTDYASACASGSSGAGGQEDVFGLRVVAPLMGLVDAAPQVVTSGIAQILDLAPSVSLEDIPPTGYLEIRLGDEFGPTPTWVPGGQSVAIFGYYAVQTHVAVEGPHPRLIGVYGGGDGNNPDTITVNSDGDYVAVLRRDVWTPTDGAGVPGTHFAHDVTYGFSNRAKTLRFQNFSTIAGIDGSVTVIPEDVLGHQQLWSEVFSSWVISGGIVTAGAGTDVDISSTVVLIRGQRFEIPLGNVGGLPANGTVYIYVDSTAPLCPVYAFSTDLPLPDGEHDVLLARVDLVAGVVTNIVDLRYVLQDIDHRVPILVGEVADGAPTPHFTTLADAVDYLSETMRPSVATSDNGQYREILIVGYTTETRQIVMNADGIRIRAAALRTDGGTAPPNSPTAVQWGFDAPLIDFNSKHNIVIEGVNFASTHSGTLATPDRVVFTNTGVSASDRVHIKNCRMVTGSVSHGFLRIVSGGLSYSVIEDCTFVGTDFGIYADAAAVVWTEVTIQRNHISVSGAKQTVGSGGAIFISNVSGPGSSAYDKIRDNRTTGFERGIRSVALGGDITGNVISRTDANAISYGGVGDTYIANNLLSAVFQNPGSKTGILVQASASGRPVTVENNEIDVLGPAPNDHAIHCQADDCRVINNVGNVDIEVANDSRVEGNRIPTNILMGTGCTINRNECDVIVLQDETICRDNRVATLIQGTGSVDDCVVEGNFLAGSGTLALDISGIRNRVAGNNLNSGACSIRLVGNFGRVEGNVCDDIIITGGNFGIHQNHVLGGIAVNGNLPRVTGNVVVGTQATVGAGSSIGIDGNDALVANNECITAALSLDVSPGVAAATGWTISDNRFVGSIRGTPFLSESIIANNRCSQIVFVKMTDSVVEDNYCVDPIFFGDGVPANDCDGNDISGNRLIGITLYGNGNVLDGNRDSGGILVTGDSNVISDNIYDISNVQGNNNSVTGNKGGALSVLGNNSIIDSNESTAGTLTIAGLDVTVTNNRLVLLTITGDRIVAKGNHISGDGGATTIVTIGPGANGVTFVGNSIGATTTSPIGLSLSAIVTDIVVANNLFETGTNITFTAGATAAVIIEGNRMGTTQVGFPATIKIDGSALTSSASNITIRNNQTGQIIMGAAFAVAITNNVCRGGSDPGGGLPYIGISGSGLEWMVQGNRVVAAAGGYNSIVLTSTIANTGHVITGNICENIGTDSAGAGGLAANANVIAHANRVGGGTVYGAAVGSVVSVISDNAQ
jgi:hypothetical protein